jgi:hypothetical protein
MEGEREETHYTAYFIQLTWKPTVEESAPFDRVQTNYSRAIASITQSAARSKQEQEKRGNTAKGTTATALHNDQQDYRSAAI